MKATLEVAGTTYEVLLAKTEKGWTVTVDDQPFAAELSPNGTGSVVTVGKKSFHIVANETEANIAGDVVPFRVLAAGTDRGLAAGAGSHVMHVRPPMNGKLERLAVKEGQEVAKGDVLFILEAMKMQNEVRSPSAGRVAKIHLQAGATVEPKQVVLDLAPL